MKIEAEGGVRGGKSDIIINDLIDKTIFIVFMKKILKIFFSYADKIIIILVFFGITSSAILSEKINSLPLFAKIASILIILIIGLWIIVSNSKKIKHKYIKDKVEKKILKHSRSKNISNIILPDDFLLNHWYENLKKRAEKWSEDAKLSSFNLYIDYRNNKWEVPRIQAIFYSSWKEEQGWFYDGDHTSETFNEHVEKEMKSGLLFFKKYNNWQELIKKAFSKVSSKLSDNCKIVMDHNSIRIKYVAGKLEKSIWFDIDKNGKITKK